VSPSMRERGSHSKVSWSNKRSITSPITFKKVFISLLIFVQIWLGDFRRTGGKYSFHAKQLHDMHNSQVQSLFRLRVGLRLRGTRLRRLIVAGARCCCGGRLRLVARRGMRPLNAVLEREEGRERGRGRYLDFFLLVGGCHFGGRMRLERASEP
jgi:hypothetical protein